MRPHLIERISCTASAKTESSLFQILSRPAESEWLFMVWNGERSVDAMVEGEETGVRGCAASAVFAVSEVRTAV